MLVNIYLNNQFMNYKQDITSSLTAAVKDEMMDAEFPLCLPMPILCIE